MMVIELSGVQFGLKSYVWFQNGTSAQRELDLKSQVWFQPKLHSTQFNYHYKSGEIYIISDEFAIQNVDLIGDKY